MSVSYGGDSITFADGSVQSSGWNGFRNRIINGDMRIDQRNSGAAVTTSNTSSPWITDRWAAYSSSNATATAVHTTQQQTTVVPPGFSYALKTTVTFGGSSYERAYYQTIEGLNVGDLQWGTASAKNVTVSFWVRASTTGTFGVSLRNYNGTWSYVSMQTINSADTWEYKTITIPGPTSGTWTVSNSWGIICEICLGHSVGITANLLTTASPNTWVNVNAITTSSQTNFVGTTGTTFYFTGFQFERGDTASSFEYRPYGTELGLCLRYYWRLSSYGSNAPFGSGNAESTSRGYINLTLPQPMRTNPTCSISNISHLSLRGGGSDITCTSGSFNGLSVGSGMATIIGGEFNTGSSTSSFTGGCVKMSFANASGYIAADAEL